MEIFTADNYNSHLVKFFANYVRATEKGIVRFISLTEETAAALGIEEVSSFFSFSFLDAHVRY